MEAKHGFYKFFLDKWLPRLEKTLLAIAKTPLMGGYLAGVASGRVSLSWLLPPIDPRRKGR